MQLPVGKNAALRSHTMDELNGIVSRVCDVDKVVDENFGDHLVTNIKSLFQDQELCDFSIHAGSKVFKVHRIIMASTSDYFRAMFSHDVLENRQDFVDLKCLTAKGVEPLINYAYSGCLTLTLENLEDVMNAATFLQITNAIDLCEKYLKQKLTFENAEYLLRIADIFSLSHLRKYNREYILANFLKFAQTEQFLNLDAETLADYLSDDSLDTTSECILLHYVFKWFEHNPKEREKNAFDVFDKVRYVIDGWPTIHFAMHSDPFMKIPKLKEILRFCDEFMTNPETRYLYYDHRTRVRYPHKTLIQICGMTNLLDDIDYDMGMYDVIHGWDRCHFYHTDLKRWYRLGACQVLEKGLSHVAITDVNDNAVICGGYEYDDDRLREATKTAQIYNPCHLSMWPLASLKHERVYHATAYLSGYVYAIGGKDDKQTLASVERLECSKNVWKYVKQLPKALHSHGAAACEGKIYISGGVESSEPPTDKVWCYDPQVNKWHKKASLKTARAAHCMTTFDDKIYVCGGFTDRSFPRMTILDSLEMYNVSTNQWTFLKSMLLGVIESCVTVLDDKITIMGGAFEEGEEFTDIIQQYNVDTDIWSLYGQLPRPLKGVACLAVTMKLTPDGKKPTDEVWEKYVKMLDLEDDSLDEAMDNFYLSDDQYESY